MKKTTGLLCAIIIVIMSLAPMAFAAVTYPQGVTKQQVSDAIPKLDTAIDALIKGTQNKTLKELILPGIYSDQVLSELTV